MARKSRKNLDAVAYVEPSSVFYNAGAYIRLSTDDKKKRGDSLETQRGIIDNFVASSPDMRLVDMYSDNNATGTNFERPGFQRLLMDIERGRINCIIVKDVTRFGRNAIDAGYYIEKYLPSLGVRFISVTDSFDSISCDGGMMLPLKNIISESYALDISRKCRSVQRQNIQEGRFVGRLAPYGYMKSPTDCRRLIIDEESAPVVQQMFEWAINGNSASEIARRLSESGVMPPSHRNHARGLNKSENLLGKGCWQPNAVRSILTDRVYVGDMVQGKTRTVSGKQAAVDPSEWICVPNTHEPVVSRELFGQVQALLRELREKTQSYNKFGAYSPNMFKGKIFCQSCGHPMHRHRQNKDGTYAFHCDSRWKYGKDACVQVSAKEVAVKAEILALLDAQGKAFVSALPQSIADAADNSNDAELAEINLELGKNGHMLKSLYESMVSGMITTGEFVEMKARYQAKIDALSQRADKVRNHAYESKARAARHDDISQATSRAISSRELTGDVVDKLVDKILVCPDKSLIITLCFTDEPEVRRCG